MRFSPPLRDSPPFTPFHPFVSRVGVKVCACIKSSMLGNEKYTGCARIQKTFTPDFLTKKVVKNTGQVPSYFVEQSHPAIIDPETFEMAQAGGRQIQRREHFLRQDKMRRVRRILRSQGLA